MKIVNFRDKKHVILSRRLMKISKKNLITNKRKCPVVFAVGSERSSVAPAQPERPPPPLPPPRCPNSGVWQWETPLNIGNLMIMNTPNPLPLLLNANSLNLEYQLYELIIKRSKACSAFLKRNLRRKQTTNTWSVNFDNDRQCIEYWKNKENMDLQVLNSAYCPKVSH